MLKAKRAWDLPGRVPPPLFVEVGVTVAMHNSFCVIGYALAVLIIDEEVSSFSSKACVDKHNYYQW
jgi:hypothetical protein